MSRDLVHRKHGALQRVNRTTGLDSYTDDDGHPPWCARGHHCTARYTGGEHGSIPEVWDTNLGRLVAVRHRSADGTRDHIEIRVNVRLDADDNAAAEAIARTAVATVYVSLINLATLEPHL